MRREANGFEFRRQLAHIFFGVIILWGIHFHIFHAEILAILTVVVGFCLYLIKQGVKVPILWSLLHFFERPDHFQQFPGRGLFFFLLGAFLTVAFFSEHIAMAALSVLLVGDAVTNLAGCHIGKIKNPLNKHKTIEGTAAGIISSFMVCVLFFPAWPSLLAATLAMIVEIPRISIFGIPIDDNVTIPLAAGWVLHVYTSGAAVFL